ncbi:DASS family sodium-coupled anion symporter [Sansalvadorimonas verongulae]|uniref:DASS family sodium-coupled anion symporter n=1 Tax=Sansalvadorimonas verongulae TaxID=2172824 RepID=UPI0012BC8401|nr:DASS family sodium-coupled anion symporter [Sansalvadorimonas verongulae]MTI13686.1 DASS family sodium-coupled anion symporter [Sansalvadorimonas verongulae]
MSVAPVVNGGNIQQGAPREPLFAARIAPLIIILALSALVWQVPPPVGLEAPAFKTAIFFIATIAAIVSKVLPTGAVAVVSIAAYTLLHPGGEVGGKNTINAAIGNFDNALIWLIVIAFMIARAFTKTGLGRRIALLLLSKFGQSSLRVAYCLGVADYLIAPATPSNTARAAIVSPIADALAKVINKDDKKLSQFLISSVSAMNDASAVGFQTGFAGNLALVGIASTVAGVTLTFASWATYLLVPSLVLLLIMPFVLYKVMSPETKATPEAPAFARKELNNMGPVTMGEWKLVVVFIALIVMWVGGETLGLHSAASAFIGLSILLLTGVLNWNDVKAEKGAWDTLIWFSVLMGLANQLKALGFTGWVGHQMSDFLSLHMAGATPLLFLIAMMSLYLFTAYFFASGTAKVVALAPVIIGSLMSLGVTPLIAVLAVAGVTNVGCNLSTYSHARNPLLMGYGYHTDSEWMKIGLVISIVGYAIFMVAGLLWWRIILPA